MTKNMTSLFGAAALAMTLISCAGGGSGSPGASQIPNDWKTTRPGKVASDPTYVPASLFSRKFKSGGETFVPMNFRNHEMTMSFDAKAKKAVGASRIEFTALHEGLPYLLLEPSLKSAKLNGVNVETTRVMTPGSDKALAIVRSMRAGEDGVLELEYSLAQERVTWNAGGIGFLTDMSDIFGRYFERWGPANFEDDQFAFALNFDLKNTSKKHSVFANGTLRQTGEASWRIEFPGTYTSSSMFVHVTDRNLKVRNFAIQGRQRLIPITIYSSDASLVESAEKKIPDLMKEMERDYGPYPHAGFIAYVSKSSGGMEYCGATITSVGSLGHELFHSWFARGVLPAEGRAGWIDEAIASWRDYGYQRATELLSRSSTEMATGNEFVRKTPSNSYKDGRALLAEFDLLFARDGGLRPILAAWGQDYRFAVVTTAEFKKFLEEKSGKDLTDFFERYVTGETNGQSDNGGAPSHDEEASLHPTPLTEAEIRDLR